MAQWWSNYIDKLIDREKSLDHERRSAMPSPKRLWSTRSPWLPWQLKAAIPLMN
jgi:hypothetical protein